MTKVVIVQDLDKEEMIQEYQNSVNRLTQIITATKPGTFTQADLGLMFDAIVDMARIERFLLKNTAKPYIE